MKHRSSSPVLTKSIATLLAALAGAHLAHSAVFVWDGGAGTNNMDTATNWNPDTVPNGTSSDVAQWSGAANLSLTYTALTTGVGLSNAPGISLDITSGQTGSLTINEASGTAGLRVQNITVASGAGALTFGGTAGTDFLTLSSSAVPNNTFTNNSLANPVTFSSDVSFGAGTGVTHNLTLTGPGNWNVNTSLIRSGSGTINVIKDGAGTLNVGNVNALGNAAFTMVAGTLDNTSGAALTLTNTTQTWNGDFAFSTAGSTNAKDLSLGTGTVSLGTTAGASRTITTKGAALLTVGGVVANGTTANSIVKMGTGGLRLDGTNTYTGGTTLVDGQLHIANNAALGTGTLTINGGLIVPRLAARTVANAVTVNADFTIGIVGFNNQMNFSGPVNLGGATRIVTVANTTIDPDAGFSGVISNGGLTKAGAGTMTLTGTSDFAGATTVTDGILVLSGTGAINGSSGITINGSGAKFLQTSSVASTPTITLTQGTLDGTGTVGTVNVGVSGTILANGNGGTATLTTGNLGFSGAATVNVASTTTGAAIAAGALTTSGTDGAITLNINRTGGWTNGANNLISYTSFAAADINDFALGSVLGAPLGARQVLGGLVLNGNNVALQINGTSIYWTGLVSNQWTVNPVGGSQNWKKTADNLGTEFIAGDDVVFNDTPGASQTVRIDDGNVSTTTVTFNNSTAVSYTIESSGGFGITSGSVTVDGTGLVNPPGTVTINNANTYAGGTSLKGSTLVLNNASAIGTGPLTIHGSALDSTNGTALSTNNAQTWNGDFSFTGTTNLDMGTGAVTLGGTGDRTVTVTANTLAVGEVKSAGAQGLTKQGAGTLAFTSTGNAGAASVLGGTLNVAAGTVQINRTGAPDAATSGDFTATGLAGSGTITNGANVERWLIINTTGTPTFSGTLANGGTGGLGLNKQGTGTLTVSGANSYTGQTTVGVLNVIGGELVISGGNSGAGTNVVINAGILTLANSNALGLTSTVNQAAGARNAGIQLQGNISLPSGVSFITTNDGTLGATVPFAFRNISGDNTINGPISLTVGGGGSIIQSDSGALTLAGNITIAAAQTSRGIILQGASTAANTVSGGLSNLSATSVASVTKLGTGNWTLSGANSYTGATLVSGGTLAINSTNSGAGSNVTLSPGATLVLGNTQALGATSLISLTPAGAATLKYATDGGDTAYPLTMSSGSTFNIVLDRATAGATVTHNLTTAASLSGFGSGTVAFTKGTNVSTLATASFDQFNLGGGGGGSTVISPGAGTNVLIGTVTKSNNNVSQTLELGGVTTGNKITGAISNGVAIGANNISVTKSDTGTWTLAGANTYTGPTNVNGGTLIFEVSETLTQLNIADGATVILGTAAPAPAPIAAAGFDDMGAGSSFADPGEHIGAVPEPGSAALFLGGAVLLGLRRVRQRTV